MAQEEIAHCSNLSHVINVVGSVLVHAFDEIREGSKPILCCLGHTRDHLISLALRLPLSKLLFRLLVKRLLGRDLFSTDDNVSRFEALLAGRGLLCVLFFVGGSG